MPEKKRKSKSRKSSGVAEALPPKYKSVWLFALFDLPVDSKQAKREYVQFRKSLLKQGFSMLQFSVYARYCPSEEASMAHRGVLRARLPPDGQVRLLSVTDGQFDRMEVYFGKKREKTEDPPLQYMLF